MVGKQPIGVIAYPLLPWIGVVGSGLWHGCACSIPRRRGAIAGSRLLGLAMLVAVLRAARIQSIRKSRPVPMRPGRMAVAGLWQAQPDTVSAIMVFFNVLEVSAVTAVSAGDAWHRVCHLAAVFARLEALPRKVLLTFGSVPLFFYWCTCISFTALRSSPTPRRATTSAACSTTW